MHAAVQRLLSIPPLPLPLPLSNICGGWGRSGRGLAERSTENHIYQERRERGERVSEAAAEGNVADGGGGGRIHLSSLLAAVAVERKRNPRRVAPSLGRGRGRSSVGPFTALRQETNLHATSNDEMSRKGLSR